MSVQMICQLVTIEDLSVIGIIRIEPVVDTTTLKVQNADIILGQELTVTEIFKLMRLAAFANHQEGILQNQTSAALTPSIQANSHLAIFSEEQLSQTRQVPFTLM